MDDKEWNEKVFNWLNEDGFNLYLEELERVRDGLMVELRNTREDHRYIQGKLDAYEAQISFKQRLRDYIEAKELSEED